MRVLNLPNSDRRVHHRVMTPLLVEYNVYGEPDRALTQDVSESGVFLCSDRQPSLGTRVQMTLRLGLHGSLRILGRVMRTASLGASQLPGFAVRFIGLYREDRQLIRRYLDDVIIATHGMMLSDPEPVPVPIRGNQQTARSPAADEPRASFSLRTALPTLATRDITDDLRKALFWALYWALILVPLLGAYYLLSGVIGFLDTIPIGL